MYELKELNSNTLMFTTQDGDRVEVQRRGSRYYVKHSDIDSSRWVNIHEVFAKYILHTKEVLTIVTAMRVLHLMPIM